MEYHAEYNPAVKKGLTPDVRYGILSWRWNRSFFMPKKDKCIIKKLEVEVVRVKITLACTECKQRNYNTTKEKKNHPERLETSKYCRFCRKHTVHKETK